MNPLNIVTLDGIRSAIISAQRLTAAEHHDAARDDAIRAADLLCSALGLHGVGDTLLSVERRVALPEGEGGR